jgi:hypothetical protein
VRRLLDEWVTVRARFFALAGELEDAKREREANRDFARQQGISSREAAGGRLSMDVWKELVEARTQLIGDSEHRGILGAIEARVRKELGYRD